MGNKLYVDSKVSELTDLIQFDLSQLKTIKEGGNDFTSYQNLKVWSFAEEESDEIKSRPILLPHIKEDRFVLSSNEAYIILLIHKGKNDISDMSSFPTSLWSIVESSSNMTPRGLMYAFSQSEEKREDLESFLLSKRNFVDSDYKYVLFIWNGRNCSGVLKSNVLMRAFELDKKLSDPMILPFLYKGWAVNGPNIVEGSVVNLKDIINNSFEHFNEEESDVLPTPSSESICNYRETVYLLKWLYPKKEIKTKTNRKNIICRKFNSNFLSNTKQNYYDNFLIVNDKMSSQEKLCSERGKSITNRKVSSEDVAGSHSDEEKEEFYEDSNEEYSYERMDVVNEELSPKLKATVEPNPIKSGFQLTKINLGDIFNKTNSSTEADNNSEKKLSVKVPKLTMSFQHKIVNDEMISQRSKRISQEEERMDNLPGKVLRKASDSIMKGMAGLTKIDIKSINLNKKESSTILDEDVDMDNNGENEELPDSKRQEFLMEYFSRTISEIIPGFLFLSSYNVAKNKEIVFSNKITHIINAAADVCLNHFRGDMEYLSYNLKDHAIENVECLFYEVINFIQSAKEKNGRVLIHCIQGISRSVTLVIAYLIFSEGLNYEKAFNLVVSKRSIASPNLGFSIQLQQFYQRLYEQTDRTGPKVFAVSSFQPEQPDKIVSRLMNESFFESRGNNTMRVFDKRGLYIIATQDVIYVWIGSKIAPNLKEYYIKASQICIENIKKYEHAPQSIIETTEGDEPYSLMKLWFNSNEKILAFKNRFSDIVYEWNNWYKEFDMAAVREEHRLKQNTERINEESLNCVASSYRKEVDAESLVDLDDLNEKVFLVACYENKNENKLTMHIWKGNGCDGSYSDYVNEIKTHFFCEEDLEEVVTIEETPYGESDEFMNLL